ncbi:MAG: DegT/DnrJ/EryC1/StrS aminotransferase family protein [Holophagales bacterium]|nr:DegT/DnrJ/EryC1/StrS aminotransferase family protein [Holophagales bacterium]MYD23702.1 DegT/DnrJ/EryC1/StrS aminotransferase family protein [Holophagales bacterium]MYI34633.1 DegT/DnrJ/EryC1/StrS aminotransferase family protein [Holophagales bacterium]
MTPTEPSPKIPFVDLAAQSRRLRPEIDRRIGEVLDHGRYVMGPEVDELEAELGRWGGGVSAVAVSSGSDALLIALLALGVGGGGNRRDAVFVPTFTFTATAEVVLLAGAVPIFVDVREEDFLIDLESLDREYEVVRAAGVARPKAVIPVDLFGLPVAEQPLAEWAAARELEVVSDAAQSFGARRDGSAVGSLAPITTTSFYPAKPLGCYGDGGAVLCVEAETAEIVRSIREHGQSADRYDIVRLGVNGRLDSLQAAVLLAKLTVFEQELAARRAVAAGYGERLRAASSSTATPWRVSTPECGPGVESSWAQYTLRVDDAAGRPSAATRDALRAHLDRAGIPTAVYYPRPMHLQPAYESYGRGAGSLPISESLADRVVSLPMHPYLDQDALDRICERIANP